MRYGDPPLPLTDVIVDTYFTRLDLAPAQLILSEFETETAVNAGRGAAFFERLSNAVAPVEGDYDSVIIGRPPALGFFDTYRLVYRDIRLGTGDATYA